jgi:MerR family transcriptional regulator, thiopeptide resistance regulator
MSEPGRSERWWTIGELAGASGVTVRTLHHYDEIGLIRASERTTAGHRRYTDADVRRLYQVRALRQLGLSLEEIRAALERSSQDLTALRDLLAKQLVDLDLKATRIGELQQHVRGLLEHLNSSAMPGPEQFLAVLERLAMLDIYLSRQLRGALAQRRSELGDERVAALRSEFVDVMQHLRRHMKHQTPVDDPDVQALAARWHQIAEAFRIDDARIAAQLQSAAQALWRDHHTRITEQASTQLGWEDPGDIADVFDYAQRATLHADRTTL